MSISRIGVLLLVGCSLCMGASSADKPAADKPAVAEAPTVVRYGVLANFPPFQVWPRGSRPGGADVEMLLDVARDAGVVLQPVRYTDYAQLEADLKAGRIQLASSMARTHEREQTLIFTPPYIQVPLALVTRADQPSGALLPDLAGRSIAVVRGYASQEQVDRLFPLAPRVVVNTPREGLEAVRSGRADTLLETLPVVADLIAREQIKGLTIVRRVDAPSGRLHLALPFGQDKLAATLAQALKQLPAQRVESLVQAWSAPTTLALPNQLDLSEAERTALAAWGAPVIGIVGDDPSFAARNAAGAAEGLSVDMLKAVLARMGVQAGGWVFLRATELQQAVLDRRIDIAIGADEGADRSALLRFVGPFIEYPTVIIGRPESGAFDLEQLQGRRLALTPNSAARPLVDSRYPSIVVVDCADIEACLDAVAAERADATLADVVGAALALARTPRPGLQMIGSEPRLRRFHSLALADRHAAVVPVLSRALDISQHIDLPALKVRWFSRPSQGELLRAAAWRYGPWAAAVVLLLAGLWLWHSVRLRRQVQRTRAAQAEAERASAANRRFTTFLAHEVRNSLHAVVAGTELARLPGRDGPEMHTLLADSARNTLHLLNNLIDRERLHAGRLVLHPEPARLSPLVQAVVTELAPAAAVRGIALQSHLLADEPLLLLDALRLQQVVRNLLGNAIKYSVRGPVEVQVLLAPAAAGAAFEAQLVLRDRGQGIAAERMAQLYEPFGASPGNASSAGLGLPLCRDLAQLMGGSLLLQPREGGGTTATLRFPVHRADVLDLPTSDPARTPALRVLVVEDAEVYSLLLVHALQQRGHIAHAVASLAAARDALQARPHELVLSDVNLPDGDVGVLLRWLQSQPLVPMPRVAGMTADRDSAPADVVALLQGRPLLEKSDDVRALVDRVLRQLDEVPSSAVV